MKIFFGGRDLRFKHSRRRSARGFTLVELMVAMMAMAAMVVIFAASMVLAEKTAHVNGQYAQAISLCQHKIDQLRAVGYGRLNYTELDDAGIIDGTPTSSPFRFTTVDDVAVYLPEATSSLAIQSAGTNVMRATVTLTWRKARHQTQTSTVSLSALISNVE